MTPRTITITLRLPGRILAPNGRPHFMAKANAVKQYRLLAWAEATKTVVGTAPRFKQATLLARFHFATNRRRDRDNLLASIKSAIDGLTDAGIVEDDSGLTFLPVEMTVDKSNPRVEITVREMQKCFEDSPRHGYCGVVESVDDYLVTVRTDSGKIETFDEDDLELEC